MKKTEELTYSPITGIIYWADVRHVEGDEQYVVCVGEKRDVTNNAIKAVYQHFLDKAKESPYGVYSIRFGADQPWLRMEIPEEEDDATD